jgi:hypothetical protein
VLDWLGSVQIRHRTPTRVELELTRGTSIAGWALVAVGVWLVTLSFTWAKIGGATIGLVGILLATLERTLVFDRDDGLLRIEQRIFGIKRKLSVPLFHLKSVVVAMRAGGLYVAYVEKRVGGAIHLDEARRSAPLLALAEAITEVTELRMVYDATTRLGS